jgi:predicted dienelactone hydrolase
MRSIIAFGYKAVLAGALALSAVTATPVWCANTKEVTPPTTMESESKFGKYEPLTIDDYDVKDEVRKKELPLRIIYPQEKGTFPVIIFSHGAGGSKNSYTLLMEYWASHGYVCITPTHTDSIKLRMSKGEKIDTLLRPSDFDTGWIERIRDLKLIMDSLDKIEAENIDLKGKMAKGKLGVGGHSFGALTSEIMVGARVTEPNLDQNSIHDNRIKAVLLLSPSGVMTHPKLTPESWEPIHMPMMVMSGTYDKGIRGEDPSWRTEPYLYSPAGSKYLIFIKDGNHMIFNGDPESGKKLHKLLGADSVVDSLNSHEPSFKDYERMFNEVKVASVVFWDAYLKGDKAAKALLDGDGLQKFSGDTAKVSHR